MEHHIKQVKNIFYITLFAGCYFVLAFTGVFQHVDSKLVGGLFELFTIPLLLFLVFALLYSFYLLVIKHSKPRLYIVTSLIISFAVIVAMFFVP